MFGLLYHECLQTDPLVFIWIFHFILPRVIRLFRVYSEWWIISFSPLHSLKTCWVAHARPKGACVCVGYPWRAMMAPRGHDRCLISLQRRRHQYNQRHLWPWRTLIIFRSSVQSDLQSNTAAFTLHASQYVNDLLDCSTYWEVNVWKLLIGQYV